MAYLLLGVTYFNALFLILTEVLLTLTSIPLSFLLNEETEDLERLNPMSRDTLSSDRTKIQSLFFVLQTVVLSSEE